MTNKYLIPFMLLPFFVVPTAQAQIDLIAIGQISATYEDMATKTATPLENGVAGNILGGVGSGFAYAGGNTFLALPDRGPNATAYNTAIDNTTSYIPRFQTLSLSLAANPSYDSFLPGSMPYILSPFLTKTTLLSSKTKLAYGVNGAPQLNSKEKFYFSCRSDNFDATKPSTNPQNGRLDPEGIRVSNDGKSVFITDEYGPYVYQFDRNSGKRLKTFTLPAYYAAIKPAAEEAIEIPNNTVGRISNKGMEALAITPNGSTLVGMMQQNLAQDTKKYLRIITIDIATGLTHEYAYKLTDGSSVSDILAINDHEFLVDERDGAGLGDGTPAKVKKLYKINLTGATDIRGVAALTTANLSGITLVQKTEFLNVVAVLNANGITAANVPAKLEGVAFGPDIVIKGLNKHTLFIVNDNDFLPSVNGVNNPNQFFVFAVDESDLFGYAPQKIRNEGND
ncbi:MAG: esterase-like activity of phytase family protein, partial [Methylococcales bacterium]|nr:esterase-like activity of phytase family protein [Methylococcales bacterium]